MATRLRPPAHDRLRAYMNRNYSAYTLCDPVLPLRDPAVTVWVPRPTETPNRVRVAMPTPTDPRVYSADRVLQYLFGTKRLDARLERGNRYTPYQVISVARDNADTLIAVLRDAFGAVAVMRDFTATETCTVACQGAKSGRDHCNCSCLGRNHGTPGSADREWSDGAVIAYHNFQRLCYVVKSQERMDYERDVASGVYSDGEELEMCNA